MTNSRTSQAITSSLLIGLIAAFALVLLNATSISAQFARRTDNEIVTHNVILGDKITVWIETDIDAEIKEGRFWVRPHGRETIHSYSYVDFTQDTSVRGTGEIDVRSPSYFPPGTIFDIRFEFTTVDGEIYTSKTYHVEHIDDAHDWRRVSDGRLEIIYYGINDRAIENLHSQTTSRLPEISAALGVDDLPQFRAVIFPNLRELTLHGPTISRAATEGHYFGGFAYDEYDLTIMSSPSSRTLIHELTHLIFGRTLTSPYATSAPAWLNEGNASYWETGNRSESLRRFQPIARSGNVSEFATMNTIPGLRRDIGNFYTQSTDFVGYLIENYGPESIGKFLSELNSGKEIDDAMFAVYGGSLAQIENGWRNEWGLRSVSSVETQVDIQRDLPPTIPGLPTVKTGTLEQSETDSSRQEPVEVRKTDIQQEPQATRAPQGTVAPRPTVVFPTPPPTRVPYFVPGPDDEWPQVKPSAIIVFLLLGLGVVAMMYRRFKT